jgi:hypothetical protein
MSYLYNYLIRMLLFVTLLFTSGFYLYIPVKNAFMNSVALNSLIILTVIFGISWVFWQFYNLFQEDTVINAKKNDKVTQEEKVGSKLNISSSLQRAIEDFRHHSNNHISVRVILSDVEKKLDESRDINRYMIGVLVFLGLLGTFWGLSQTISAIAKVISAVDINGAQVQEAFSNLKKGLESPLQGMGTAFSSSLFGLIGSLSIGFLDMQYSRACGAFFSKVEDNFEKFYQNNNISNQNVSVGDFYNQSLLGQTVEAMSGLVNQIRNSEENRLTLVKHLNVFSEKMANLAEQVSVNQSFIKKVAQNQLEVQDLMLKYLKNNSPQEEMLRQYLRSIDQNAAKILEESVEGRTKIILELRNEIRIIAKTLSALAS